MHAPRYIALTFALLSCAETHPVREEPDYSDICLDDWGDYVPGQFAHSCGGWRDRCEVCGEMQTCDNDTRTCQSTCGPSGLACANNSDCPAKGCAEASCSGGKCVYQASIVEGGGCLGTKGAEVFAGICDDCDCVQRFD